MNLRTGLGSREHRGTITLWLLGCCLMVLALGGMSLDLWRAFSERRALASAADAAALAGASAIDEDRYRSAAEMAIVPELAAARARASLRSQLDASGLSHADVVVNADTVTVTVRGHVGFSLLRMIGDGGFDVEIASTAMPRRSA